MQILVATGNKHKLEEIHHILRGYEVEGRDIKVKEDGLTFEENAIKKVKSIHPGVGQIAIADDSGLMVDCLGGRPGVKTARFASPPTAENLCLKLIRTINRVKQCEGINKAKFVCVIAVKFFSGKIKTVKGICRGEIIHEMCGCRGFGYDQVFVPTGYKKTFAEMSPGTKNRLSHRGQALKKLKLLLAKKK